MNRNNSELHQDYEHELRYSEHQEPYHVHKHHNNSGYNNIHSNDMHNKYIVDKAHYDTQSLPSPTKGGLDRDDVIKIVALLLALFAPVFGVYNTLHDKSIRHEFIISKLKIDIIDLKKIVLDQTRELDELTNNFNIYIVKQESKISELNNNIERNNKKWVQR